MLVCLDCDELYRLLAVSNIDEGGVLRILCNRSIGQRLQIRDKFKTRFNQVCSKKLLNVSIYSLFRILVMRWK